MTLLLAAASLAAADKRAAVPVVEVGPAIFQAPAVAKPAPKAADLVMAAPRLPESARHPLGALSAAERQELLSPDRRGGERGGDLKRKRPALKVGISRVLPAPVGFNGLPADVAGGPVAVSGGLLERAADGSLAWTASFSSTGAGALRLYLRQARLPAGSLVYVYSEDGQIQGPYDFARGTRPEGFWTNTIFSDRIFLEARFPATIAPARLLEAVLSVAAVVHLEHSGFAPSVDPKASQLRPKSDSCFVDRSCVSPADFPNVDLATRAVGQLTFVDGGSSYVCTGGLMNTTAGSSVPYLLTANHCFSSQASATSLEAYWQYRTATCNGPRPNESLFPRTLGSTLLATGSAATTSDFTLVQLSEAPPNDSWFLGWTTADVVHADGLVLYRLSYPNGDPMIFTRERVTASASPSVCSDAPQGNFIYEKDLEGGTGGGSSGSPVYLEDLRVVGQEFGSCGTNTDDNCDTVDNSTIEGAFQVSFPSLQQWLAPGGAGPCVSNATTLCLNGGRYRVTAFYATEAGTSGAGAGIKLTGDSGYFWFFSADNIELVVKVLNGCAANNHTWVFAGGLTNVGVTLLVEDTTTGASKVYTNPANTAFQPLQDTQAFSCP